MARREFCIPCGRERRDVEAVTVVDGDPMCKAHAGLAAKGIELVPDVSRDVSAAPHIYQSARSYTRELHIAEESRSCFGTTREIRQCRHPECIEVLAAINTSGTCSKHAHWGLTKAGAAAEAPIAVSQPSNDRTRCRKPDCGRTLASRNCSGVCGDHSMWGRRHPAPGAAVNVAAAQAREKETCRHPECGKVLQPSNRTGVCFDHKVWGQRNPVASEALQDGTKCRHPECEKTLRGIVRLRSTVCVEHYTWSRKHPLNPRLPRAPKLPRLRRAA
jgi:hypothetical protein